MPSPLSRRTLISTAAATATLAATADTADAAKPKRRRKKKRKPPYLPQTADVVVVGAGLAGLTAARELIRKGVKNVILLEARDRVGGRVLNHHLKWGGTIEKGGAFVGPTQDHLLGLARDFRVDTFLEYNEGRSTYIGPLGKQHYTGTVPPDLTILPDAAIVSTQLDSMAAEINVEAPWDHPKAAEWDAISLGAWVRANTLNPSGILEVLKSWTQPGWGADPDELSFLYVLWYVACSGNETTTGTFSRNSDTAGGAQESRFVGGSGLIPERMAASFRRRIRLNTEVRTIDQRGKRVRVVTSRGVITARRVIVACPPSMVQQMRFLPAMPKRRQNLLRRSTMGQLMKCDAVYATPFWREQGLNGFGLSTKGAARAVFDNSPADGHVGVLLAFVGGSTWRTYGSLPVEERRAAVIEGLVALFGEQARHPIDYVEYDWVDDPWAQGGPTALHGPGVLTSFGSAIRTPHRRVHWAGTETATYWSGYMDGAIRSGKRAAAEVREALR
jgi:monoamine oxidase